jgi:hypothetical protein
MYFWKVMFLLIYLPETKMYLLNAYTWMFFTYARHFQFIEISFEEHPEIGILW